MKPTIVLIGIGEMAGVFAKGLLRLGHPLHPVTRDDDISAMASQIPGPALTLVTVREGDLEAVLSDLPAPWRHTVALVQNDLVPSDWERHHLDPTVAVVWFEKKPGRAVTVIRPTIVGGPGAKLVVAALHAIDIDASSVGSSELVTALVAKNLYIGVSNIAGLTVAPETTVGSLWADHRDIATAVAGEILDIQEALVGQTLDRETLVADMVEAFAADPDHGAMGRSAPHRLERAVSLAAELDIDTPTLLRVASTA